MTSVFWPGRAILGEGPLWDPRIDTLYWVDIAAGTVFAQAVDEPGPTRTDVGAQVGCLGLTEDPRILVAGLRNGWHLLDIATGSRTFLADPEADRPACRFNDGSVDPAGCFWTGSLEDGETRSVGRLYRLRGDGGYSVADVGFFCSNGIDWSPDSRWMYFVDSRADVIYRYDFDVHSGAIGDRKIFLDTTSLKGIPDGLRVDAEGFVWCSFWDGSQVTRFRPDGNVAEQVPVPVPRPTSVAFVGPSHDVHHFGVHWPLRRSAGPMAAVRIRSAIRHRHSWATAEPLPRSTRGQRMTLSDKVAVDLQHIQPWPDKAAEHPWPGTAYS